MFSLIINLFPGNYNKKSDSNIYKLLKIIVTELQEIKNCLDKIKLFQDVDRATGSTLDNIGRNVGQFRGFATDEVYRILIKSKIARNMSTGDINTVIDVLSKTLNSNYSSIEIVEMYNDDSDPEPSAIKLLQIPIDKINEVGMSSGQFGKMVARTLPGGVGLKEIRMEGTFEFGDIGEPIDNVKGFGDLNDESIGGTLGATYSPTEDREFPL